VEKYTSNINNYFIYRVMYNFCTSPKMEHGPFRILPGRLSVSRSFGDAEAKIPSLGGNPQVLISTPEITSFKINKNSDFIILGCDGIFDKLTNTEVVQSIWAMSQPGSMGSGIFDHSGRCVDNLLKNSLARASLDNLTSILICFENFKNVLFDEDGFNILVKNSQIIPEIRTNLKYIHSINNRENENLEQSHQRVKSQHNNYYLFNTTKGGVSPLLTANGASPHNYKPDNNISLKKFVSSSLHQQKQSGNKERKSVSLIKNMNRNLKPLTKIDEHSLPIIK
jgi:hypothetical protein